MLAHRSGQSNQIGGDLINIYKALSPQEYILNQSCQTDAFNMMKSDRQINASPLCLQGRKRASLRTPLERWFASEKRWRALAGAITACLVCTWDYKLIQRGQTMHIITAACKRVEGRSKANKNRPYTRELMHAYSNNMPGIFGKTYASLLRGFYTRYERARSIFHSISYTQGCDRSCGKLVYFL